METTIIPETEKLYLNDTMLLEASVKIVKLELLKEEEEKIEGLIYFDQTVFHPQGGGQPNDEGSVKIKEQSIKVVDLVCSKGHKGIGHKVQMMREEWKQLEEGEMVEMKVDGDKRLLYARLHSAGHLLDMAVARLGYQWHPSKGCHFPVGAYVEYVGAIDPKNIQQAVDSINTACQDILTQTSQQDHAQIQWLKYEEAKKTMEIPAFLPTDKDIRFIKLSNEDKGCMCGGTHVPHLNIINKINVRKINKKGKCVRVAYDLAA